MAAELSDHGRAVMTHWPDALVAADFAGDEGSDVDPVGVVRTAKHVLHNTAVEADMMGLRRVEQDFLRADCKLRSLAGKLDIA